MTAPLVGVVIPTRNRAHSLARALTGLEGQTRPPDQVVVVSDGSTDHTASVVAGRRIGRAPCRLVTTPGIGSGGARNAGWHELDVDIVAFLDDDCVPDPSWLDGLTAAFDDPQVGLAQGRTVPAGPVGPHTRTIDIREETGLYESCNIAYRLSALRQSGGFDESFNRRYGPFGEDTDLAWRVKRTGWGSRFVEGAVVRHEVRHRNLVETLRAEWRRGYFVDLVALYPELRSRCARPPWFLRPQSPWAQLALLGLLLAPFRWRGAVLLTAPYLAWLARSHPPDGRLPQILHDAVGSAALLRGSLRAQRIVL